MSDRKAQFEEYYNCHLLEKFAELECERHKQLDIFVKRLLLTGAFIPLLIVLFWIHFWGNYIAGSEEMIKSTVYVLAIYACFSVMYCSSPIISFQVDVKAEVMEKFANFWGDFSYSFCKQIPEETITKSKIFPYFDNKDGDDYFSGIYQGVKTIISEEELTKTVRTKNGSHNMTVFKGIVILLEMNKKFAGQTIVLKDAGIFNFFKKFGRTERVKLEDVEFERKFEVYADNQIEARYLLTTAFMERILKVKQAYQGKKIQFSFFDNKLLIAVETKENMFEVSSLFRSALSHKLIDRSFDQFATVTDVIDTLKLQQSV